MKSAAHLEWFPLQYLGLPLLALGVAFALQQTTPTHALVFFLAAVVFILALVSTPIALYLLIFSMLLSPEFMIGQLSGRGLAGRGLTLRVDDLLLLVIGLSWLMKSALNKELGLVLRTPLNRPILIYFGACVIATIVGMMAGRVKPMSGTLFTLKYFEYFFVYFMIVNHVRTPEQARRFLIAALATAVVVCLYAIGQIPGGGRVSAPFEGGIGEPNTLGGYLVLMFSVVVGLLLNLKKQSLKLLLVVVGIMMLVALSATLSRSSYVALGVAMLMLMALSRRRLGLAIGLVCVLLVSPFVIPERVKERVTGTVMQQHRDDQVRIGGMALDTSTSYRLISWETSTKDWMKKPLFGYGVAGYGFVDAQYFKVLVDTGLIGIVTFMYLLYALWNRMVAAYRDARVPWIQGLTLGALSGYAGLLVHAIGANTFIIVRIMEPFWLLVGLIVVTSQLPPSTAETDQTPPQVAPTVSPQVIDVRSGS